MRTDHLIVSVAAVLLVITAGLVIEYGLPPSKTESESTPTLTSILRTSSSSTIYPSRAYVAIVGSSGTGDDAYFMPSDITVAGNATVIWTNQLGGVVHDVTFSGKPSFASGDIIPGMYWSFTFTKPGTYYYYCSYHPWMIGSVTVVIASTGS